MHLSFLFLREKGIFFKINAGKPVSRFIFKKILKKIIKYPLISPIKRSIITIEILIRRDKINFDN